MVCLPGLPAAVDANEAHSQSFADFLRWFFLQVDPQFCQGTTQRRKKKKVKASSITTPGLFFVVLFAVTGTRSPISLKTSSQKLCSQPAPSCSRLIYIHFMARNASQFAENWPTSRSNEYRQKKKKNEKNNKWCRPTHVFLHLKSLVRRADERSSKLMSFRLGFFMGNQSESLHDEKLPVVLTVVSPSVLKHLSWSSDTEKGCSSSSWVAAYLGSTTSLSTSEKKSNNPHIALRRKDVFSSSHRSLRLRSYIQCSFARTSLPRTLSICGLCFGSAILGANACVHPFSSLLSMLGSHRDKWEAWCSGLTLRTLLGDRRRKDDGRKKFFSFAIAVPQGPKVRTGE